jgi:hypothetical protein
MPIVLIWGAVKIRERETGKFRGKCQEIPTTSTFRLHLGFCQLSNFSTSQLLNISASQHLDISTSLLYCGGILLNLFYVVHTRNGVTKLFGISTSPISTFTKLKLGSGPSIYCRSLVLGIWCPVMLGAHKNPCLDFPFIHPRPPIGRFRRKKQRISHSGRIISGSKGLRFII